MTTKQTTPQTPTPPPTAPAQPLLTAEQFVGALFQVAMQQSGGKPGAMPNMAVPQDFQEKFLMMDMAGRIVVLDDQIRFLKKTKREIAVSLMPMIHKHGQGGKLTLSDGTEIVACVQNDKRAKKKSIVAFFGVEKAEKF